MLDGKEPYLLIGPNCYSRLALSDLHGCSRNQVDYNTIMQNPEIQAERKTQGIWERTRAGARPPGLPQGGSGYGLVWLWPGLAVAWTRTRGIRAASDAAGRQSGPEWQPGVEHFLPGAV